MLLLQCSFSPNTGLPTFIGHGFLKREGDLWKVSQRVYEQFRISEDFLPDAADRKRFALTTTQRTGD